MSSATARPQDFPKLPLRFAFGMIAAALIVATGAKIMGHSPKQSLGAAEVDGTRLIRFATGTDGSIAVLDAATGETIAHTAKEGFVPGVLRGLNRLRRTQPEALAAAYRLEHLSNGQLLLIDTASGLTLDLNAYGHANAQVFQGFLPATGDKS